MANFLPMHIAALNVYPIKGCRGTPLDAVRIDRLGLTGDRRLMLVDSRNRFISQRDVPRLATIDPSIEGDCLHVRAPGRPELHLEIDHDGIPRPVSVWGHEGIISTDQGDSAAAWFTAAIGVPCRLVFFGKSARNPVDSAYSPRADAETAFTDGYPIMATLAESLDDLNTRLADPIPMQRFRPSVVIGGAPAWSEDNWKVISLGEIICDVVKPCARCAVTTTDQTTGERHAGQEPLRTLATFRHLPAFGAIFGQNLVPRGTGTLRVGDLVETA